MIPTQPIGAFLALGDRQESWAVSRQGAAGRAADFDRFWYLKALKEKNI
jgi:hypothetical protein